MAQTSSLAQNVSPVAAGAHVVLATFLGRTPVFALADGQVLLADIGEEKRVAAHADAAILVAASDGQRVVTGGDDGRIVSVSASGGVEELANEKGKWIDAVAARESGETAWSAGKAVRARDAKGVVTEWQAPSSVQGLAFLPKGYRLAVSHYNGVSLWFPATKAAPDALTWKGSHLDVTVSPDSRFVVTSMQENSLHGWRVADKQDMRMTGYPSKPRSFSWSHDGNWLATSGAEACIIWPFQAKNGPMGQQPRECGVRPAKVSKIAFHPKTLVLAIGYEDGWLLLCRLTDGSEILVRAPEVGAEAGEITALSWDKEGKRLAFGAADGFAGLLTLP